MNSDACEHESTRCTYTWGCLEPMVLRIVKGELDGLFVPYESVLRLPREWTDGSPWIAYRHPRGQLLFRDGAYRHYGYEKASDFAVAVYHSKIRAKTISQMISLGWSREVLCHKPYFVGVRIQGAVNRLEMKCENQDEALSMCMFLREIFPKNQVLIAENSWKRWLGRLPAVPPQWAWTHWHELPLKTRRSLHGIFLITFFVFLACSALCMNYLPFWIFWGFTLICTWMILRELSEITSWK